MPRSAFVNAQVVLTSDDLLKKLPPAWHKATVKELLQKIGHRQPLNIFCGQEIDRLQVVIILVRRTLQDLKLAIAGTIVMSTELQEALDYLYDSRVPPRCVSCRGMDECGVVWCGVVCCGVVWCGVVWCGVVWCGVVWCGVVWCGVVWYGMVCQRCCYQKVLARMVLHVGKCKPAGLCV